MGFFGNILGLGKEKSEAEKKAENSKAESAEGKYYEKCVVCGEGNTEKKWAGQYWHKKCLRRGKKIAKGML